jgi:hypothetical protein
MVASGCPECGAVMEEGFIPDHSYAQVLQLVWQRGEPEPLKFFGMSSGSIGLRKEDDLNVTAKRCTRCGYLKLYALPKTD